MERALTLLRTAPSHSTLGTGRAVLPSDVDRLFGLLPTLVEMGKSGRERIIAQGRVFEAQAGTKLVQSGETGESAYFVLAGKVVAGTADQQGGYRSLSSMTKGDFFGEIAALTGATRTADVVAEEVTQLLQVPANTLRMMMAQPAFSQLVLSRMSERLARTTIHDLPRLTGIDPQDARELREVPSN